jgi:hypothetical protein
MKCATGNQYASRKRRLLTTLRAARSALASHRVDTAQWFLSIYHAAYAVAPASTRRRWKCGR